MSEEQDLSPQPSVPAPYELRLHTTDLDEFRDELQAFAVDYENRQLEPNVERIRLTEDVARDQNGRPVDPLLTRVFAVDLYLKSSKSLFDGPTFWVTRRGNALILSFTNAYMPETRPFLLAFIERCKAVWSATLLQRVSNTNQIAPAIMPPSIPQRPTKEDRREQWFEYKYACDQAGIKCTHRQLAKECGISHGHFRAEYSKWKDSHDPDKNS